MAECSQAAGEVLLEQPWLPVCISDCQLLAKAWFGDTSYHLLLTDMRCVWEERMDTKAIQTRAQELNKRLRAPVKAFYSHLREVAQPCLSGQGGKTESEALVSFTRHGDGDGGVSVRLKSELAGLPFHWEFHCNPPPVPTVCSQLVRPLLVMSQLLQTQVDQLGALLARKDAEIQDYKENGATLSRARLQTDVFDELAYKDNIVSQDMTGQDGDRGQTASQTPAVKQDNSPVPAKHDALYGLRRLVSSGQGEGLGFDADLRELYSTVVAHGNPGKRKRALSEDRPPEDAVEADRAPSHTPAPGLARCHWFPSSGFKDGNMSKGNSLTNHSSKGHHRTSTSVQH
ncbi:hypothetical protein NHX12_014934 [Muraenolepis orangiensis]|uniref:Non-homologous end-joining factor 1 n=1 Tax=Muraenolepis orangiensis TaxID=630683 RepID=A0A9Q0I3E7_9TELE|nr:hypothetical protein NHX12_014934 [Muraenolepis orangiensis]